MKRTIIQSFVFFLVLPNIAAMAQSTDSNSEDSVLINAKQISAATGRPIFAVAGRST